MRTCGCDAKVRSRNPRTNSRMVLTSQEVRSASRMELRRRSCALEFQAKNAEKRTKPMNEAQRGAWVTAWTSEEEAQDRALRVAQAEKWTSKRLRLCICQGDGRPFLRGQVCRASFGALLRWHRRHRFDGALSGAFWSQHSIAELPKQQGRRQFSAWQRIEASLSRS